MDSPSRNTSGSSTTGDGKGTSPNRKQKRKTRSSLTSNACTNCKQAKAKCDGSRPACGRCVSRKIENGCRYELHVKTAKEQMLRDIQMLQRQTEVLTEQKKDLEETHKIMEQIMSSVKANGHGTEIIRRLKRGDNYEAIVKWLERQELGGFQPRTERKFSQATYKLHKVFSGNPFPLYWTGVAKAPALIEHLISLYLTWIHPTHMLFDQDHFMHSFRRCSDMYCSAPMVNAICAVACPFLHEVYRNSDLDSRGSIASLRDQFIDETKYWISNNPDYSKMTNIQTYAILFLVELGCGHSLLASSHLRTAAENLVSKQVSEQSFEAEQVSRWGILTLHTAWSCLTYQKPSAPISSRDISLDRLAQRQTSDHPWPMYTTVCKADDDEGITELPSHALETAIQSAKLFHIVHENVIVYSGFHGKVTAQQMVQLYERYLVWKKNLPSIMTLLERKPQPLPHILFLHVQYHTALIQFFQPLLEAQDAGQGSYNVLRSLILKHAYAGLSILRQYQCLYSVHFFTPLQIFCMVHICDALVHYDSQNPSSSEIVTFCLATLEDTRAYYPVARPLLHMFRTAIKAIGLSISDDLERRLDASARLDPDELLDACTRPTCKQPSSQILTNTEAGLGQSFVDMLVNTMGDESRRKQKRMDIGSMLNQ